MTQDKAEYMYENKDKDIIHSRINAVAQKFISDLREERERLESNFPLCTLLIDEAIERIYSTGRIPGKELYADVYKQKPIKLTQKVYLPIKQFPKFNFTGKLLGPKGNSLRRLQEETQCKITIKGRNSMRDRNKEEELRNSGDPKYSHLNKDLYYEISTISTPAESYARIAYALAEIRKYLVPDKNDEISHQQLRELLEIDPDHGRNVQGMYATILKSVSEKKSSIIVPKYMQTFKKRKSSSNQDDPEDEPDESNHISETYTPPIFSGYSYNRGRHISVNPSNKRSMSYLSYKEPKRRLEPQ